MLATLRELIARRDLLYMITWREVAIKYKQSVMGFLWAILMPIVIVSAGLVVRLAFARLSGTPLGRDDITLVTVKAVPWAFFVSAVRFSTNSLITNTALVTKIYMPREIFPIAAVLSQLLDFAVASVVVIIVLPLLGVRPDLSVAWVPLFVLLLILQTLGAGLLLSAAALFFRDVKYLVEVSITFAIFFTPVFYEASLFGPPWRDLLMINPVAPLLEGIGAAFTRRPLPDPAWLAWSALWAVGGLAVATGVFKRLEPYFAESV